MHLNKPVQNNTEQQKQRLQLAEQHCMILNNANMSGVKHSLLASLLPTKKIIYLDPNQFYAIVEGSYLKQLLDLNNKKYDASSEKNNSVDYEAKYVYLKKKAQLLELESKEKAQTEQKLINIIQRQKQEISKLTKIQLQFPKYDSPSKLFTTANTTKQSFQGKKLNKQNGISIEIQTQYQSQDPNNYIEQQQQIYQQQNKIAQKQGNDNMQIQAVYRTLFEESLKQAKQEITKKLVTINELIEQVKNYSEKNQQLAEENNNLKAKLRSIDEKQEKICIFKSSLTNYLEKLDKSITEKKEKLTMKNSETLINYDQEDNKSEIQRLKLKVIELQKQNALNQSRLNIVENIFKCDEVTNDDGILGNISKLSNKLKQSLKKLILDIND